MDGDFIKATPQNPIMGLLSQKLYGLHNSADSAGLGDLSAAFGVAPAARLFENMSYGSPPYKGTGMATRLSPDLISTVGAATNLGGFAPIGQAGRLASGAAALPMLTNESLDSVIQQMLNKLGQQNK